jgi:acyl dehydratase
VLRSHQEQDRERQRAERKPPDQREQDDPANAGRAQDFEVAGQVHGHIDCRAVPVNTEAIGKAYPPFEYEVGKEKIAEYARVVGEESPVYFDRGAATEAGFRDVVAPPMFAVVYAVGSVAPGLFDPDVGIDFAMMVHGSQEFVWGEPVCSGDVINTVTTVKDISERGGMGFYVFESVSTNQDGQEVVRGTWTNIVRGVS